MCSKIKFGGDDIPRSRLRLFASILERDADSCGLAKLAPTAGMLFWRRRSVSSSRVRQRKRKLAGSSETAASVRKTVNEELD